MTAASTCMRFLLKQSNMKYVQPSVMMISVRQRHGRQHFVSALFTMAFCSCPTSANLGAVLNFYMNIWQPKKDWKRKASQGHSFIWHINSATHCVPNIPSKWLAVLRHPLLGLRWGFQCQVQSRIRITLVCMDPANQMPKQSISSRSFLTLTLFNCSTKGACQAPWWFQLRSDRRSCGSWWISKPFLWVWNGIACHTCFAKSKWKDQSK